MEAKKLPNSQVEIQVTVPAADFEKYLDSAAEELSQEIRIDGFRPGKAPRSVIEQKIGSEKIIAHAAEKAVKKTYVDHVVKNKIEAVGEPQVTITKIAAGNDLEYKAVVAVMPSIELGGYRKRAQATKKKGTVEIKPEDVEKELGYLQKSRAKLITVSREAAKEDRVEIDFNVSVAGKEIDGGKSSNHPLVIGESYFIPGFEDNLVGMKEQDEKEFELTFPEDYHHKELAGKLASFKVKMKLVQEKQLAPIDDEFAKSLGNFENLEVLKKSIKEGMAEEARKKSEEQWRHDVLERIISEASVEIPDILLKDELGKMMTEFEQNIAAMGMKMDQYLANIKKGREEVEKGWQETARKRVISALALKKIAELEEISVESSEIEQEMNKNLAYFKNQGDLEKNVDMEKLYNYIKGTLIKEKVFKFLENL